MLYRIFTEDIPENYEAIEKVLSAKYPGFTIIKSTGYWRLQKENSLIVEIVTQDEDAIIDALAKTIKDANKQEAVLIQKIKNNQWFV